ncbi:hypothetical protein QBC37DRAFT_442189 [Rhypophila decipiens]|uniref:Uncharacterized protein n=1 Tax=Rhypophila decipiens TaxID=261697 RepID=A0AAN6Y733_9PEZI|nr:hypothetical protein QBC37DRAFT_442189 [Rhypophila decipiens]
MDAAAMVEDSRKLKQGFIIATLASTIAGTFTTGINLFDRLEEKRRNRKQRKVDKSQNQKIKELEGRLNEKIERVNENAERANENAHHIEQLQQHHHPERGRIRDDDLRDSLGQGGPMVKREYDRHYAAMGPQFAEGDLIAQNQLQAQVITMQSTVIKILQEALLTGDPPDMAKLYNASELARIGSIRALRDQAQRLQSSHPRHQGLRPADRGRPVGLIRRTSSTPSLRSSITNTSTTTDTSTISKDPEEEYQKSGPLFCLYAKDLQQNPHMRLDEALFFPSSPGCPACGGCIPANTARQVTVGGGHIIDKEVVVTERVTRRGSMAVTVGGAPAPVTELVKRFEDRAYLLTPRFVAKCHRPGAERGSNGKGYACYLCFRNRERDTLLRTVRGLVGHVRDKHDVGEYEDEVDIRRV